MAILEEDWGRRCEPLALSLEAVSGLLRPAFPGARVASAEWMAGGKVNTNLKVRLAGREAPVVLRVYQRDPSACAREVALYALVRGRVPVPEVYYAAADAGEQGWPYAVMECLEGELLSSLLVDDRVPDPEGLAYRLGGALAAIASFSFDRPGFLGPDLTVTHPFEDLVDAYLGELERCLLRSRARQRLGEALAEQVREQVAANRSLLDSERQARSLVHQDYKPQNLLVRPGPAGWQVTGVLDWEFAGSGSPLSDAGNLLRHEESLPPGFADAFARGFVDGGGPLPQEWRRKSRLLDLVCLAQFLDSDAANPAMLEQLRQLVEGTLAVLRT